MGAALDYRVYPTDDKDKVREQWVRDVENADNSTYCGEIGLLGSGLDFSETQIHADVDAAVEFLDKTHYKEDVALAIPFRLPSGGIGYVCGGLCPE